MANWKFTDQYGKTYPALANSILALLVFDVPDGTSPVSGTTFSAPLDLKATGKAMSIVEAMVGATTIAMTGTVTTTNNTLTVSLESSDDATITAAIAKWIPLVGGKITEKAWVSVENITPGSATVDDEPTKDEIDLNITIAIGSGKGTIVSQIPMSDGLIQLSATFQGFGVKLSDLDFLAGGSSFSKQFPDTLPDTYYKEGSTALELLSLTLGLNLATQNGFSVTIAFVSVSIGLVNIPLYKEALFLNPLAVWVTLTDPLGTLSATWGLTGDIALYPHGKQTNPPSVPADFTFELAMQLPTKTSPTFAISGNLDNPNSLPVATVISDLMNDGSFNTGIANNITIDKFDFNTVADTQSGTISDFTVDIAMSSPFGLFATPEFGIKDFSISVAYSA